MKVIRIPQPKDSWEDNPCYDCCFGVDGECNAPQEIIDSDEECGFSWNKPNYVYKQVEDGKGIKLINDAMEKERLFQALNPVLVKFWKDNGSPDKKIRIELLERMLHWYKNMGTVTLDNKEK